MVLDKITRKVRLNEQVWDQNPGKHPNKGMEKYDEWKQEEMVTEVGGKLRESDVLEPKRKTSKMTRVSDCWWHEGQVRTTKSPWDVANWLLITFARAVVVEK